MYIHTPEIHNPVAARVILPFVFSKISVNSVVDIGCGIGTWLQVVEELGISDYLGIDGDWVERNQLHISSTKFLSFDLVKPIELGRKFDLAICLEVVEHLPLSSAETIVNTLVTHADTILFSAAIPKQGGQSHINEQEVSFWIELFKRHGFQFYDLIRPEIWKDNSIEWWYKQNIFLVSKSKLTETPPAINNYIHPDMFYSKVSKFEKLKDSHDALKSGKLSPWFYLKLFLRSLLGI